MTRQDAAREANGRGALSDLTNAADVAARTRRGKADAVADETAKLVGPSKGPRADERHPAWKVRPNRSPHARRSIRPRRGIAPSSRRAFARARARATPRPPRRRLAFAANPPSHRTTGNIDPSLTNISARPLLPTPYSHPPQDIDAAHANDPHMVAQYAEDIYDHLRAAQGKAAPDPRYMETFQTDINATMREILVDWLVEVAEEYKLSSDTLYLSVWYIDRVLSVHPVPRAKLQLVGVTCMLVAAKYEEIYAPQVDEFCYITDNTYERQDVLAMERTVLDALDFELTQPTVKTFLRRCLRAADADAKTEFLANYLAEASLLDYRMLRHPQSSVAASAVYVARETLGIEPAWTPTLERYAKVAEEELRECVAAVKNAHAGMQTSKLSAVREKYAQVKFKCVSMIKPLECR